MKIIKNDIFIIFIFMFFIVFNSFSQEEFDTIYYDNEEYVKEIPSHYKEEDIIMTNGLIEIINELSKQNKIQQDQILSLTEINQKLIKENNEVLNENIETNEEVKDAIIVNSLVKFSSGIFGGMIGIDDYLVGVNMGGLFIDSIYTEISVGANFDIKKNVISPIFLISLNYIF